MTLYKKLILTFTLAAGLSALPNAFAAPVAKPKPTPIRQDSTRHGEDKIEVLAALKQRTTTVPAPSPAPSKPISHGLDNETVFVAFKNAGTTPAPGPKPNTTSTPRLYGEDKIDVLAAAAPPKQVTPPGGVRKQNIAPGGPKHSEDSATVLAAFKPPVTTPGSGPKPNTTKTGGQNQEQDSTIV